MGPKPMKHYPDPSYPARLLVIANPSLLHDHQPPAWRARGMASVAAVLIAATCGSNCTGTKKESLLSTQEKGKAVVAPVFVHGNGRGLVGCVITAPPVFLSEEEAMTMIEEELGKNGLNFSLKDVEWSEVRIPYRECQYSAEGKEQIIEDPEKESSLFVDREDPVKHIAFEFISERDYPAKGGIHDEESVEDYNLISAAQNIASEVQHKVPEVYFGTFYDPMTTSQVTNSPTKDMEKIIDCENDHPELSQTGGCFNKIFQEREEAKRMDQMQSLELLRLQVQDFINWLKAQGAI